MTGYVYRGRKPDPTYPDLETLNAAIRRARTTAVAATFDICGTAEGWQRHRYRHEKPCQACRTARAGELGTMSAAARGRTAGGLFT